LWLRSISPSRYRPESHLSRIIVLEHDIADEGHARTLRQIEI